MAPKAPDWQKIATSEIWRDEIRPMLAELKQVAQDKLMKARGEDIAFLQGKALAYHEMLSTPLMMAELEKIRQQQERDEEEERETDGRGTGEPTWGRRLARRLGLGRGAGPD